jgi:hypothetical protein
MIGNASSRAVQWVALAVAWAVTAAAARAELRFPQPTVNVGVVRAGMSLSHRFTFVNDDRRELEIVEARASCGCLSPKLDKRVFRPGEEGSVVVEVNTLSQPAGVNTWTVHLKGRWGTTDCEMPLQLTADLLKEIWVEPAFLALYTDRAATQDLLLTDSRPKSLTVVAVETSSPRLRARVYDQRRDKAGRAVTQIRLDVAEEYAEGRHDETVRICTDDPAYRELKVPVTVIRRSRQHVSATPAQVALSAPPGQPFPSKIVLVRGNDEGVVVEKVVADHPAVVCTWAPGPNTMATLRIRADRSLLQGDSLETAVHVYVSKPRPDVLTIPVTCTAP